MLDWRRPVSQQPVGRFEWCGFSLSSNVPLPRLRATCGETQLGEVEFTWLPEPPPCDGPQLSRWSLPTWDGGRFDVAIGRDERNLVYDTSDTGRYVVSLDCPKIDFYGNESSDPMMVEHALVHSVLGIWAGLNGFLCLHASAVAKDGRATLFVGPSGIGKSTNAWKLMQQGWSFVTDDVALVHESKEGWFVYRGPGTLRIPGLEFEKGWFIRGKKEIPVGSSLERAKVYEVMLLGSVKTGASLTGAIPSLLRSHACWPWTSIEVRKTLLNSAARLVTRVRILGG